MRGVPPARTRPTIPHLLSWVHLAFTDSFLTAHELWGAPIPGGSDEYVARVGDRGRADERPESAARRAPN